MSSLIPHDYRYKISSPTPVDKEPKLLNLKEEGAPLTDTPSQNLLYIQLLVIPYHLAHYPNIIITFSSEYQEFSKLILNS